MNLKKTFFNKSSIYLFLFVLFSVASLFAIKLGDNYINLFLKSLRYLFLLLYYLSVVKKINYFLVLVIFIFFFASAFLNFNSSSVLGLLSICLSRVVLIKLVITNIKSRNIDWKLFITVTLLFVVIGFLVLSLYYNNSPVFYVTILSVILLTILLSLSFLTLLNATKKWNLLFFSAISLFVISDAIFGIQTLTKINPTFLILASTFYNFAYFLIVQSDVKKQNYINRNL